MLFVGPPPTTTADTGEAVEEEEGCGRAADDTPVIVEGIEGGTVTEGTAI